MDASFAKTQPRRFQFVWILDRRRDLVFYVGSALAGWLYVGVIWYAIQALENPVTDALGTFTLGGIEIPLTLELLVVASWAFLLDAPHIWATLGRTLLDPDEWRVRGTEIRRSFLWFLLGPVAILTPYLIGVMMPLPAGSLAMGAVLFFVFFRLWAYYHVVRQHWGFFRLYKRKANDYQHDRLDYWFFNLTMYLPLLLFMTSAFYANTPGYTDLGLATPLFGSWSAASLIHPTAWAIYLGVIGLYLGYQGYLWYRGVTLNGSKLLYLLGIIPLHLIAFSHPILVLFVVPIVTVGHNIQYHCIVYSFAQNKYAHRTEARFRWAKRVFKNVAIYAGVGLLFTFGFYRGPWIEWLKSATGLQMDEVLFNSLGMMAGVQDPAVLGLGEQITAAIIIGFAMQHYYLDAKIWRVSKDKEVQKNLRV